MKIFGYKLIYESDLLDLKGQVSVLEKQVSLKDSIIDEHIYQNNVLKKKVDEKVLEELIDIDIGDPTPQNPVERREYIARVAGFYDKTLKPKCVQMISMFHRLVEDETNDLKTDTYLKIGIYICREFMKWGEQAVNEHVSYQAEATEESQRLKNKTE